MDLGKNVFYRGILLTSGKIYTNITELNYYRKQINVSSNIQFKNSYFYMNINKKINSLFRLNSHITLQRKPAISDNAFYSPLLFPGKVSCLPIGEMLFRSMAVKQVRNLSRNCM